MSRSISQKGFSLLELLLVISIAMLIAVGVFRTYKSIDRDTKITQSAALVEKIFHQAAAITAQNNNYTIPQAGGTNSALTTTNFLSSLGSNTEAITRMYPPGVNVTTTQIYHPFDGLTNIQSESSQGTVNDLVAVRLDRVPSAACLSLLQRVAPYGVYDMSVAPTSGGTNSLIALLPAATADSPGRNTVSVAKGRTACNRSSYVNITFRMLKPLDLPSMRRSNFGVALSPDELARIQPLYTRQQNAMAAREAAQNAL